ncbi:MAG TPA: hypothetical protein PLZ21_11240 [Armatimonadota bacterium]|nr:hypothetical protein [Armatimonadota bacterium]
MEVFGATRAELEELAVKLGEPKYRGGQLADWIYKKDADDFDEMTNLPLSFRQKLEKSALLTRSKIVKRSTS